MRVCMCVGALCVCAVCVCKSARKCACARRCSCRSHLILSGVSLRCCVHACMLVCERVHVHYRRASIGLESERENIKFVEVCLIGCSLWVEFGSTVASIWVWVCMLMYGRVSTCDTITFAFQLSKLNSKFGTWCRKSSSSGSTKRCSY